MVLAIDSRQQKALTGVGIGQASESDTAVFTQLTGRLSQVIVASTNWGTVGISLPTNSAQLTQQDFIVSGHRTLLIGGYIEQEATQDQAEFYGALTKYGWPDETYWGPVTIDNQAPVPVRMPAAKAFSQRFSGALTRLHSLLELKPNWDSYGAVPPSLSAVARSFILLGDIDRHFEDNNETLPEPFVAPVPDGKIQLDWEVDTNEIEVTVNARGTLEYLLCRGNEVTSYTEGSVTNSRELGDLLLSELFRKGINGNIE